MKGRTLGHTVLHLASHIPSVREALNDERDRIAGQEQTLAESHARRSLDAVRADERAVVEQRMIALFTAMLTREIRVIEQHAKGRKALKSLTELRGRLRAGHLKYSEAYQDDA